MVLPIYSLWDWATCCPSCLEGGCWQLGPSLGISPPASCSRLGTHLEGTPHPMTGLLGYKCPAPLPQGGTNVKGHQPRAPRADGMGWPFCDCVTVQLCPLLLLRSLQEYSPLNLPTQPVAQEVWPKIYLYDFCVSYLLLCASGSSSVKWER